MILKNQKSKTRLVYFLLSLLLVFSLSIFFNLSSANKTLAQEAESCAAPARDGDKFVSNLDHKTTLDCFDKSRDGCEIWGTGLICSILTVLSKFVDGAFSALEPLLIVRPIDTKTQGGEYVKQIWSSFQAIANVTFVIIILLIIYSQVTGTALSNYTIKKALPRLIVNIILLNASFVLSMAMIDVFNILGGSLKSVLDSITDSIPRSGGMNLASDITFAFVTISTGVAAGTIAWLAGGFLVPYLLAILVTIATVIVILIVRQALMIVLVIVSPLAFALNTFPNTQKYFSKWWSLFLTAGMVYPLVAILAGAGSLISAIIHSMASGGPGLNDFIFTSLALGSQILPLILIPRVVKTGFMNVDKRVSGFINGSSAPVRNSLAQKAANKQKEMNINRQTRPQNWGGKILNKIAVSEGKNKEARRQITGTNFGRGVGPTARDHLIATNATDIAKSGAFGYVYDDKAQHDQEVKDTARRFESYNPIGGENYPANAPEPTQTPTESATQAIPGEIRAAEIEVRDITDLNELENIVDSDEYDNATRGAAAQKLFTLAETNGDGKKPGRMEILEKFRQKYADNQHIAQGLANGMNKSGSTMFAGGAASKLTKGKLFESGQSTQQALAKNMAGRNDLNAEKISQLSTAEHRIMQQGISEMKQAPNTSAQTRQAAINYQKLNRVALNEDKTRNNLSPAARRAAEEINRI